MSVWFYLNEVVTAEVPLLCTESKELCLRVAPTGSFVATYSSAELWHNSTGVSVEGWTHVLYRYNAEGMYGIIGKYRSAHYDVFSVLAKLLGEILIFSPVKA